MIYNLWHSASEENYNQNEITGLKAIMISHSFNELYEDFAHLFNIALFQYVHTLYPPIIVQIRMKDGFEGKTLHWRILIVSFNN